MTAITNSNRKREVCRMAIRPNGNTCIDWLIDYGLSLQFEIRSWVDIVGCAKYLASGVGKDDYGLSLQFNSTNKITRSCTPTSICLVICKWHGINANMCVQKRYGPSSSAHLWPQRLSIDVRPAFIVILIIAIGISCGYLLVLA